jgi:hypothetical protein
VSNGKNILGPSVKKSWTILTQFRGAQLLHTWDHIHPDLPIREQHSYENGLCKLHITSVRCQVLTAESMKSRVFWDVAPCIPVKVDRHFRDAYCLHHRGV